MVIGIGLIFFAHGPTAMAGAVIKNKGAL